MSLKSEVKALLVDALDETGAELSASVDDAAEYIAVRSEHLANAVGEPGFDRAVRTERNNIALHIGLTGSANATSAEERISGILQGVLRIGATLLA